MKTVEDLEMMTVPQLKGIATNLGVDVKVNIKKPELVKLVFDIQQPEPQPEEVVKEKPQKPITMADEDELLVLELEEFQNDGLSFSIDGNSVRLCHGQKIITTTIKQPTKAIISIARTLCKK